MAMTLGTIYERIKGGWKTVGAPGVGAFAGEGPWNANPVGPASALKLSAYYSCIRLLSETMGAFTFQIYDNKNNVVDDHDLYGLMRYSTNQFQCGDSFVGGMIANMIMSGNSMAHIRRYTGG